MNNARYVYEDPWGAVIDHPRSEVLEIRWYDTSKGMTGSEFNAWLETFATMVEALGRTLLLVDAVQFQMPTDKVEAGWRDRYIVPRYNAAGVERFAFIVPEGAPVLGKGSVKEAPAEFPTAYFSGRGPAMDWLTGCS